MPFVLQPEGDVAAGVLGHDGVGRILQHQPEPAADADVTGQFAGDGGAQGARERVQQRRLAGTGRPHDEHPLARLDRQSDVVERRRAAPHGSPRQALDPDGSGFEGDGWRGHPDRQAQTSPASSRPAGNASSTPGAAEGAHQQPAAETGDHDAGEREEAEIRELVVERPVGVVGVPLVDRLEGRRECAGQAGDSPASTERR